MIRSDFLCDVCGHTVMSQDGRVLKPFTGYVLSAGAFYRQEIRRAERHVCKDCLGMFADLRGRIRVKDWTEVAG